jgi:hypothetical protein
MMPLPLPWGPLQCDMALRLAVLRRAIDHEYVELGRYLRFRYPKCVRKQMHVQALDFLYLFRDLSPCFSLVFRATHRPA